jgi:hypothetical protein
MAEVVRHRQPDSPPTQITKLLVTPQSIGGDGQIALVWGTDEVAWTTVQNGKTTSASHKGMCLNVLRRQANGSRRGRTICGMTQWRGMGAVRVTTTPLARESLQSDSITIQNILQSNNTLELVHICAVHNRQ